ncbi:MAG TPA: glutathione S-transferase domain-containing protein, partial [Dongiaceae bacterium]
IAAALPRAETCLAALEALMDVQPWLAGPQLTLADLHAAPIFAYAVLAPEGAALLARHDGIRRWWEKMAARASMAATRSPLE